MASDNAKPHVIIIGAGLGGLTLAQCLRKQGIPFEIFDRDTDITTRQGWAIAVHSILEDLPSSFPSDMPPLRESADHLWPLKLEPQVCFYGRGQRMTVENTPETPCLRLNRLHFRQWLATQIPIQWGKRLVRVEDAGPRVTVHFEDGTSASGDILIGADGVKSVVRQHLLGRPNSEVIKPVPFACIWGEIRLSGDAFERQLSLGHSAYAFVSPNIKGFVFVALNKVNKDLSGDYYWYVGWEDFDVNDPEYWLNHASKKAKYDRVMEATASLEPRMREVFELTDVEGILPGQRVFWDGEITSLPVGRITLLGDAIHPMTPFRGEGGVHAIRDALNLGAALSKLDGKWPEKLQSTLESYQQEVLERGSQAVRLSRNAIKNNQQGNTKIVAWGYEARPTSEENVLLENCRP
ncbi:FAD/NAD(P)-binding domain-containing protein [Poronia punctata]|nr:FAD/NAD(P)-binding domain-containing protein [Poronia punctata]